MITDPRYVIFRRSDSAGDPRLSNAPKTYWLVSLRDVDRDVGQWALTTVSSYQLAASEEMIEPLAPEDAVATALLCAEWLRHGDLRGEFVVEVVDHAAYSEALAAAAKVYRDAVSPAGAP